MLGATACDADAPSSDAGADASADDAGPPPAAPTADTALGPLEGLRGPAYQAFLGIPYAKPPVGALRWAPPEPPDAWTEPRTAIGRPPRCVQRALGLDLASQEDCLYLNVHTPDPRPEGAPVMVWLHGGAFLFGEGLQTDEGTAGDLLAATHGVVVVSLNYRLGPYGFLAHPALTAERGASGNYGLMDQRLALEWVRDNIAAFGGDPDDVTIFGESAGGLSVCAHLISPESEGLFHRAISQSGLCDSALDGLSDAEAAGERFADALSCADAECLRAASVDEITTADGAGSDPFGEVGAERAWWPIVDGAVLEGDFRTEIERGAFANVPTIVGWNADEGTLFVMLAEQAGQVADEAAYDEVVRAIAARAGVAADDVFAQYPLSDYPDPGAASAAVIGHATLACPSRRAALLLEAAGVETRVYQFTYPDAGFQLPTERELGAFHSAEIQYVFGHPSTIGRRSFTGDDRALYEAMSLRWTDFARGAPSPDWPRFGADETHLRLDREIATGSAADAEMCALWDGGR